MNKPAMNMASFDLISSGSNRASLWAVVSANDSVPPLAGAVYVAQKSSTPNPPDTTPIPVNNFNISQSNRGFDEFFELLPISFFGKNTLLYIYRSR